MFNIAENTQIISLARQGMNAGEISAELGLPEGEVRLIVGANNETPIAQEGEEWKLSKEEKLLIKKKLISMALSSESEFVSAKVGLALMEHSSPKAAPTINLTQINQSIFEANKRFNDIQLSNSKPS